MYTPHQIECMKKLGIKFLQAGSLDAIRLVQESGNKVNVNDPNVSGANLANANSNISDAGAGKTSSSASPIESLTKDMVLEPSFEKDLLVLFPQMKVVGQKVQLTDSFSWLIESKSTRVIATKTQLITASINDLSTAQKQQVWSALAPLVSQK